MHNVTELKMFKFYNQLYVEYLGVKYKIKKDLSNLQETFDAITRQRKLQVTSDDLFKNGQVRRLWQNANGWVYQFDNKNYPIRRQYRRGDIAAIILKLEARYEFSEINKLALKHGLETSCK